MTRIIIFSFATILLIAAFLFSNHYVPFQVEVFVVYFGICLFAVGLASVIKPFRFLHINSRKSASLIAGTGLLVFIIGAILPAPMIRSSRPPQLIDYFMSEYQFYEYHEMLVNSPAETVSKAMKEVAFTDIPVATWLMRIRVLASGRSVKSTLKNSESTQGLLSQPIVKFLSQPGTGFLVLDDQNPNEYVGGMVGKPWSNDTPPIISGPDEFNSFHSTGNIKVAFNIRVVDMKNGLSRLSSETRIVCIDVSARRLFSIYWRIIYPGSAIIRRVWLNAIAERAVQY